MNDYYYNPEDYYQLTAMDKDNGWTVKQDKARLTYCQNSQLHDPPTGEPALREWHSNGQLWDERYCQNGQLHDSSTGEPARRSWHDNGQLRNEFYCQDGQLYDPPTGEPAYRYWHDNGQLQDEGHCCRGVEIPAAFWSWTIDDALACENTEQRRVWFEENGGWETFEQDFHLVDEQPDPANYGHTLRLCDFPQRLDVYRGDARIIFCDNASLDLDGTRRRYGLIFPKAWGNDALAVIARSFGLSRDEYTSLGVAK